MEETYWDSMVCMHGAAEQVEVTSGGVCSILYQLEVGKNCHLYKIS